MFKDGHHIRFGYPSYRLGGLVGGERSVELIGSCTWEDFTNDRKAVVIMNTHKQGYFGAYTGCKDVVEGVIYESKKLVDDAKSIKNNYSRDIQFVTDIENPKDCINKICSVEGSWLKELNIDGVAYWNMERDTPIRFMHQQGDQILPSDCRYREDLIWLKYNYVLIAH